MINCDYCGKPSEMLSPLKLTVKDAKTKFNHIKQMSICPECIKKLQKDKFLLINT